MENFVLYEEICTCEDQIIYKARRKGTINFLAISCTDKKRRAHVTNHVRFARALNHKYILKFHEWYETSNHLWVVMDLCTGCTLDKMLREDKMFPEFAISDIGRQLVAGLHFIHSSGIIYADWFPTRIFLDGCGNIKYFDFSYSRMENERSNIIFSIDGLNFSEFDGLSNSALPYIAPEILAGAPVSRASDIWSLGCIFFKMFFSVTPFSSQVSSHLVQMIRTHEVEIPIQCTRKPSNTLWDLLCAMLTKGPEKRIILKDIMNHKFWQMKSTPGESPLKLFVGDNPDNTSPAFDVDVKRNGVLNGKQNIVGNTLKTLKRSVSMGDSTLASAALLRNKTAIRQASLPQKEETMKEDENSCSEFTNEGPDSANHAAPIGDANFTLHAQSMRSEVFDAYGKSSVNTDSNEDSVYITSRSNSKLTATLDSTKKAFFESNDSLNPPTLPMTTGERMTKSEYAFHNSDTSGQFGGNRFQQYPFSEKAKSFVSPQVRARIALCYPWGEETLMVARETAVAAFQGSNEWENLEDFDVLSEIGESHPPAYPQRSCYISQPLGEYEKWIQNPPRADLQLPFDLVVLAPSAIESLTNEEINSYSSKLLALMTDSLMLQDLKNRPSAYLGYVAWFLAVVTLEPKQDGSPKSLAEANAKERILRIKHYMSTVASSLQVDTMPVIVKTWLCRIVGLLVYRSSFMLQHDANDPNRDSLIHALIVEVAPELPSILSTVVDILSEPAFKSAFLLKQASITALGELIICEMCIYSRILIDPMAYDGLTLQGFDVSTAQWQSALLRIIRSLSPTILRTGNAHQNQHLTAKPIGRKTSSLLTPAKATSAPVTENSFRLSAARALNETIVAIHGLELMQILQCFDIQKFDRGHPGVQLAISLSSSLNSFLDCLLTPKTVSRVWTDGVMGGSGLGVGDGKSTTCTTNSTNSPSQQVVHTSAGALAGLIRLRPSLFMCGLIDRNETAAFMQKLNPTTGSKDGASTTLTACLLSATATGLILPLSFDNKPLGASFLRVGVKSGTPVACRRFLNNPQFFASIMRQLESPHSMLRAKAYLLVAAALDSASGMRGETLITACNARLPSCLERDLRMTNQHYVPRTALEEDGVLIDGTGDDEGRAPSGMSPSTPPGLRYLGICVKHISDLMVQCLIPNICKKVAVAIGTASSNNSMAVFALSPKPSSAMTSSTHQERPQPTVSSAKIAHRRAGQPTSITAAGVSLKSCLPAFSCLPGILASSASIRNRLLLSGSGSTADAKQHFCLIEFMAKIFDHWASVMGNLSAVNSSSSAMNQLLCVTLALAEDISRQLDVVECRRVDLIKALLSAIARLAVAPASDSITRTICVKVILDVKNIWCGGGVEDSDSVSSSNVSLNSGRVSGLNRSPLSSDRLNYKLPATQRTSHQSVNRAVSLRSTENKRPASSSAISTISTRSSSSRVPYYRPNSFYGRSSNAASNLKGYKLISNLKINSQGPSSEVLFTVVDIVNSLLIPYVQPGLPATGSP